MSNSKSVLELPDLLYERRHGLEVEVLDGGGDAAPQVAQIRFVEHNAWEQVSKDIDEERDVVLQEFGLVDVHHSLEHDFGLVFFRVVAFEQTCRVDG